jgi:peptide/nickel transport system substrate-binding protein
MTESDKNNLKKIYNQLEDIIQDYSPIVPLYYDMSVRLVQKNIYGLNNNPFNLLNLKSVYKR